MALELYGGLRVWAVNHRVCRIIVPASCVKVVKSGNDASGAGAYERAMSVMHEEDGWDTVSTRTTCCLAPAPLEMLPSTLRGVKETGFWAERGERGEESREYRSRRDDDADCSVTVTSKET